VLTLLSQRNFFLLWVAHTISILGDYVFFIGITFWIYQQTSSAVATGLVLITSTIPAFLFAPLAALIVDRWSRRSIMFTAESARALLFIALLVALLLYPHLLWPIYLVGFLQSAFAAFFWPTRSALLPQLINPSSLLAANALYMLSDSAMRIIAPTLSTFALLHLGSPGVVIIDAITFIISAGSICLLTTTPQLNKADSYPSEPIGIPTKTTQQTTDPTPHTYIMGIYILGSIIAYTAGMLSILFPIFAQTIFSANPLAYGWLLTAQAIGEGAMSILLQRAHKQQGMLSIIGFISGCFVPGGLALILLVYLHTLISSLLLNLVFGAITAEITVQLLTFLQQRVANRFLGRILTTYSAIQALALVGGMGLASITIAHVGVAWPLVFDGSFYLLASILAWIFLKSGSTDH
jgi:MFS transporter, DHA3 family, macrolide efflux protein